MTAFQQLHQPQHDQQQAGGAGHRGDQRRRSDRRRRWRRAVLVLVPALPVAGLLGGQAYARLQPTGPVAVLAAGDVGCFDSLSLRGNVAVQALKGRDPAAACRQVWTSGEFPNGWFGTRIGQSDTAPDLVTCVTPTGGIGVFPGAPGDCAVLGLRPPTPAQITAEKTFDQVEQAIVRRVHPAPGTCKTVAEVRAIVTQELAAGRLTGWRVTVALPDGAPAVATRDTPCTTLSFDPAKRAVYLVPSP